MGLGFYWLRSGHRKKDVFYYAAWALQLAPTAFFLYVVIALPEARHPAFILAVVPPLVITLYLLRDYLPWWPRSGTERTLDAMLPSGPDLEGLEPANPLLDRYDAVSRTGRWAVKDTTAVAELRFRVDPDPAVGDLRRATRAGVRAAVRLLGTGQGLRTTGDLRRVAGPDIVAVGLVLRGPAAEARLGDAAEAFDLAFCAALGDYRVTRTR